MLAAQVVLFGLALWLGLYLLRREPRSSRLRLVALCLLADAFGLAVSASLLFHEPGWSASRWVALAPGALLVPLGCMLARREARMQGEALAPDLLSSLDGALCAALLFGGPVALVMLLATGPTLPMLLLLLVTLTCALATQVFASQLAAFSDRLALAAFPQLRRARADLRATADALPRLNPALDLGALDEAEFLRLTRRAFTCYSDLGRLAASPLTALPVIEARLAARGAKTDALERAIELKALLTECIERLKPPQKGDFGTSPEWRYYNALYFPYVLGLKAYRRHPPHLPADPTSKAALAWLQTQVPERTLHHWQHAATALIAQELRGQLSR